MPALSYKLTLQEREDVFTLATKFTGACQSGDYRRDVILFNVESRIFETGCSSLAQYLEVTENDPKEYARLLSAVTIHTTSWFREYPHYEKLKQEMRNLISGKKEFRILSFGCSTGEEVYSFAMVFETLRNEFPNFLYEITGRDIDPVSVNVSKKAIYPISALSKIPPEFKSMILLGEGKSHGYFTIDPDIRKRCHFEVGNIANFAEEKSAWDLIICRNVLIYFAPKMVETITANFVNALNTPGILCFGHSEVIDAKEFALKSLGNAVYLKTPIDSDVSKINSATQKSPKKLLIQRRPEIILVGASTGGPEALVKLLRAMPKDSPPVMVVQHITINFAKDFALRLAAYSGLRLGEMVNGEKLKPEHLYIVLGDYHLEVQKRGSDIVLSTTKDALTNGHRPSVDNLFRSAAKIEKHCLAILLTGMGNDGAVGLKELKEKGSVTLAQDEASSVVFGMPKEAQKIGAVDYQAGIEEIRKLMLDSLRLP